MTDIYKLRGRRFNLILNVPKRFCDNPVYLNNISNNLKTVFTSHNIPEFYFILHIGETNEQGELKTPHFHIVVSFGYRVYSSIILDCLREVLSSLYNDNLVSIEYVNDMRSCVRYLIHYDNSNKKQYDISNIVSNNRDLTFYFLTEKGNLTPDILLDNIHSCSTKSELLTAIGLENFKKYLNVINTLWFEIKEKQPDLYKKYWFNKLLFKT